MTIRMVNIGVSFNRTVLGTADLTMRRHKVICALLKLHG